MPAGWSEKVTVVDTDIKRATVTQTKPLVNSSRFNDTFNLPVWPTTSITGIEIPSDWSSRGWGSDDVTAGPAVVKMMHPSAWGSWAFEVGEFDSTSKQMKFSKGGNQEARGGSGVGDLYVVDCTASIGCRAALIDWLGSTMMIPQRLCVNQFHDTLFCLLSLCLFLPQVC